MEVFSMKTQKFLVLMTTLTLLVIGLIACGKGSNTTSTAIDNTDSTTSQTLNAQVLNDTPSTNAGTSAGITYVSTPLGNLPAIPDETRSVSEATITLPTTINGDQVKKIGDSYIYSEGCSIVDTSLVMDSGDRTKRKIAWAMYEVGGFEPKSTQLLNMASKYWLDQDRVDVNKSGYFVAVSNFSKKAWEWHGPFKVPETEFALHPNQIHTSVTGYLYFMLVVFDGDKGTHELTTIMEGTAIEPTKLPAPSKLVASDGKHNTGLEAAGVLVHWEASDGAAMYVIERLNITEFPLDPTNPDAKQGKWLEIGRTPELGFFDGKVVPGTHYLYRAYAIAKDQKSDYSNTDEGWWIGDVPPPPVNGKVVGLRVALIDEVTKKEFGSWVTPNDATVEPKVLVVPANTRLAGRVVNILVQVVKEDGSFEIQERLPNPEDNIWWGTEGGAFPEIPAGGPELHTFCAPDTNPVKPTIGMIVCTLIPNGVDVPKPPRPIPQNLKELPAVIIPTKLVLDERASNIKEVYTYDNAKLNPEATQYFYFRVEPEFVSPILEWNEFNCAPDVVLTPVIANENPEQPFIIDPARPHIRIKYDDNAFTVPSPGYFTAYTWPWTSEIKQWKFKIGYSPDICPPVSKPTGGDPVDRILPHGLYRLRFMNNIGYSFPPVNPIDDPMNRPGGGETPTPPAYGPELLDGQFHLHPANLFLPVKGVIEFL